MCRQGRCADLQRDAAAAHPEQLDELGVTAKRVRRTAFAHPHRGVPADMTMYRLETRRQLPAVDTVSDEPPRA